MPRDALLPDAQQDRQERENKRDRLERGPSAGLRRTGILTLGRVSDMLPRNA